MGRYHLRSREKEQETQPHNDTAFSSSQEGSSSRRSDFANRPPGTGGEPSPRLIHLRRAFSIKTTSSDQALNAFDTLDTQYTERDRTNDRPSSPALPPLEQESYYHHLIPTNGDRNQCAIEAITIARGILPQNAFFHETVAAIEKELEQEQIRDLGEMINLGDDDGTAMMAYLRSTTFLDDTRPIEVYSRHPQTGQLRHIRIGDGPAEPYRVFYQHETLHYWGLPQRPLENPSPSNQNLPSPKLQAQSEKNQKHPLFAEGSIEPEVIQQLAGRFIDAATNHTQIQGITITGEQCKEVKDALFILKENKYITKEIREKAAKFASNKNEKERAARATYRRTDKGKARADTYNKSDRRKAVQSKYNESDKGKARADTYYKSDRRKAVQSKYNESDEGKARTDTYNKSDKGKSAIDTFHERKKLLKTSEGRRQLVKDRFLYEQGYLETPDYTQNKFYDDFWKKNQDNLKQEEEELLGTKESQQKIIDDFIENNKDESEQESE